jgi:hypothetical protein
MFPSVDDIREAARDPQCKNVVVRFLRKFWSTGGRALAFDVAAAGTVTTKNGPSGPNS